MTFKTGFILFCIVLALFLIFFFWARIRGYISGRRASKVAKLKNELTEVKKQKEQYRAQKDEAVNDANEQAKELDKLTGNNSATEHIRDKWYKQ